MKKIAVFGPRDAGYCNVYSRLVQYFYVFIERPVTIITSKKTSGWDAAGRNIANNTLYIELWTFKAYWDEDGGRAGPLRNALMAQECDFGVTGAECGGTPGTANMIKQLQKLGKEIVRI